MNILNTLIKKVADNVIKDKNIQPTNEIKTIEDLHDYLHYDCKLSNEDKGQVWYDMLCFLETGLEEQN